MLPAGAISSRRFLILLFAALGFLLFTIVSYSRGGLKNNLDAVNSQTPIHHIEVEEITLRGDAIMGKLGNETLKAELGRAAWKLFHTTMARFPDEPTEDESTALFSYMHLFARLYPCGECAGHFRQILNKFPPQVDSRSNAAAWGCHVHNEVNKSLKKDLFDCSNIGDFYDCGCAEDTDGKNAKGRTQPSGNHELSSKPEMDELSKLKIVQNGRDIDMDVLKDPEKLELKLEKEGLTRGG